MTAKLSEFKIVCRSHLDGFLVGWVFASEDEGKKTLQEVARLVDSADKMLDYYKRDRDYFTASKEYD